MIETKPYIAPPNTTLATSVSEMVDVSPVRNHVIDYKLGESLNFSISIKLKNKCVATPLRITHTFPSFLISNHPPVFNLDSGKETTVIFSFNEQDALNRSIQNFKTFEEQIHWTIEPFNVVGPVYVSPV